MSELFEEGRERHDNGVRVRFDGRGDPWAGEHRVELGHEFYFQDLDAVAGYLAFAKNDAESLFAEYVPDRWENRNNLVRAFATVAFFDRKQTSAGVHRDTVSLKYYLNLCRQLAELQPVRPRFFFVVGLAEPWEMVEVDIDTGERKPKVILTKGKWLSVWRSLGLDEARKVLTKWVQQQPELF